MIDGAACFLQNHGKKAAAMHITTLNVKRKARQRILTEATSQKTYPNCKKTTHSFALHYTLSLLNFFTTESAKEAAPYQQSPM
jgi:hypothetical protein